MCDVGNLGSGLEEAHKCDIIRGIFFFHSVSPTKLFKAVWQMEPIVLILHLVGGSYNNLNHHLPPNKTISSAGFRKREALGYYTCEAPPNYPPSQLEGDGSVFNQFQ